MTKSALLLELIATFKIVACSITSKLWKTMILLRKLPSNLFTKNVLISETLSLYYIANKI